MRKSLLHSLLVLCLALPLSGCCSLLSLGDDETESSDDDSDGKKKSKKKSSKSDSGDDDAFVAKHMKLLLEAAHCDSKSDRMEQWCQAAEGFANGKRAVPSKGVKVGTSTFIVTKDANKTSLDRFQSLSCLAVRKDGKTYAAITSVKPDSDSETRNVNKAREDVIAVLEGDRKDVRLALGLKKYVDTLPAAAKYRVEKTDSGFRIDGGSNADVRRVGSTWIAVEVPRKDPKGIYVSIFTDAPYR